MAKFYGKVGYARAAVEGREGIWEDEMLERYLYGDVQRNTRRLVPGDNVNSDLTTTNTISVLADAYALNNIFAIRYVEWMGSLWTVSEVEVQAPRLLLRLGGVYNGPTPPPSDDSGGGTG